MVVAGVELIGFIVVVCVVAAGIKWIKDNVSINLKKKD